MAFRAARWNRRSFVVIAGRPGLTVLTEVPRAAAPDAPIARNLRRHASPFLLEPSRIEFEPVAMFGNLHRRQPPDVFHEDRCDLQGRESGVVYTRDEVVVFPVRPLEAFVEQADPVEYQLGRNPETAVEATRLDRLADALPLADDERTRHGISDTEIEYVPVLEPAIVVDGGDEIARREAQADVDVMSVARPVVDDDQLLAFVGERRNATAKRLVCLLVERPMGDDDAQAGHFGATRQYPRNRARRR